MEDTYRVLPHRNVLDCTMYSAATGQPIGALDYEHVPCGMSLTRRDIVEANWCPHCSAVINKAAQKRGEAHRRARVEAADAAWDELLQQQGTPAL